jgi:hypothetical protein
MYSSAFALSQLRAMQRMIGRHHPNVHRLFNGGQVV